MASPTKQNQTTNSLWIGVIFNKRKARGSDHFVDLSIVLMLKITTEEKTIDNALSEEIVEIVATGCQLLFHWNQINMIFRSSHTKVFHKKGILKNLAKFTGKYLFWSRADCYSCLLEIGSLPLYQKETLAQAFSCKVVKLLRTTACGISSFECCCFCCSGN